MTTATSRRREDSGSRVSHCYNSGPEKCQLSPISEEQGADGTGGCGVRAALWVRGRPVRRPREGCGAV